MVDVQPRRSPQVSNPETAAGSAPVTVLLDARRVTNAVLPTSRPPVPRDSFVGIDQPVPVLDGRLVPYVNLDNAASTPALRSVIDAVDQFLPFYSGVHRGSGYKSRLSTATFERARELVGEFLGADPERDVVVFTKNTTEAINKLARALPVESDSVVLTTMLEHHSNDLPWRARLRTVHVGVCRGRHAGCRRSRSSPD